MNDTELEQWAFEAFADMHPHEAREADPARFLAYFQKKVPGGTLELMEKTMKDTDTP